jgi:hypothetical protein
MRQTTLVLATLAILALPCRADETDPSHETLIRLTVSPAPAPKPVLRYQLLPELNEMNPGNPIQNYMKCFLEQQKFFFDKEAFQRREKLLAMPLKELPAQDLQDYGGLALSQADWAARLDNPDWQILLKLKAEGIGVILPEVQSLRSLATALKVRFRAEVAVGRFDKAVRTAKTMFAISRHLGEHPTFVANLVGCAIANTTIGPLEEMLEQPGCPNLYWALTNLPNPLVSLDVGRQGERVWILWAFRDLDEVAPMSPEQLQRFLANKDVLLNSTKPSKPGESLVQLWLNERTKDPEVVRAARRRLVEHGIPEERLQRFPADQVILLDEKREFEVRFDDMMKLLNLPIWQIEAPPPKDKTSRGQSLFADALVPVVYTVRHIQGRLDQRIALLRHVEALRLYADGHKGTLPANLSEIPVPLPVDPFTGKPFRYEVQGNTAHLRGTPPPGEEKNASYNIHYEVTLQQ